MARVIIKDCLKRVENRFFLVHAVARRVRQMRQNAQYWAGSPQGKEIVTALREIAAGKINIKDKQSEDQEEK